MLKSMTAFGRGTFRADESAIAVEISAEIKSVNGRYFDCNVKLPKLFSCFEENIKSYIQNAGVARGKVDVYISAEFPSGPEAAELDTGRAAAYIASLRRLRDEFCLPDDISVMRVAQNRDIFKAEKPGEAGGREWELISAALAGAVSQFSAARETEGAAIERDILLKLSAAEEMIAKVGETAPRIAEEYSARLRTKLDQLLAERGITADEGRIITECAIFADRVAVDEELVRLGSHLTAFREIINARESAGRKLDFMLQEINREINTIGSKCSNAAVARIVVDIKSEFEKIREQVQNIE